MKTDDILISRKKEKAVTSKDTHLVVSWYRFFISLNCFL